MARARARRQRRRLRVRRQASPASGLSLGRGRPVYVDAAQRHSGVARTLYGALFELLREQGLRVACAGITLPNQASVALHESLGFERVGVFRGIGWKAGQWRDVGWWQLDLAPRGAGSPAEPLRPIRRPIAPRSD